ncbi:hypothetical protein I3W98_12985, partial [Streptomyces cavourensis]|nr:hypothetical protein [Streptomyces cavourensis]
VFLVLVALFWIMPTIGLFRGAVVHFDVGLHEGALAEHAEALRAVLRARGHRVTRNLHNGGHDYACWRGFLADALVRLMGTGADASATRAPVRTSAPAPHLTWTRQGPRVEPV